MIRNIIILAVLLGLIGVYTFYEDQRALWAHQQDIGAETTATHPEAPDFEFRSLSGKSYSLSDFRGKVIVLNFWASWCAPCLVEFPQMLDLASLKKDKTVFLFISVDAEKENMNRFLKKLGKSVDQKNVIIAHDPDKSISQTLFQTYKLPETILIDSDFKMQDKIVGASVIWNDKAMLQKIDDLY